MARIESVEVDLDAVASTEEVHALLKERLAFPEWYGCNWDAFWDSISGLVEMPRHLKLKGWASFESRLPRDAKLMRECLAELQNDYPEQASEVEYA